jgi:hypothetical protein
MTSPNLDIYYFSDLNSCQHVEFLILEKKSRQPEIVQRGSSLLLFDQYITKVQFEKRPLHKIYKESTLSASVICFLNWLRAVDGLFGQKSMFHTLNFFPDHPGRNKM